MGVGIFCQKNICIPKVPSTSKLQEWTPVDICSTSLFDMNCCVVLMNDTRATSHAHVCHLLYRAMPPHMDLNRP